MSLLRHIFTEKRKRNSTNLVRDSPLVLWFYVIWVCGFVREKQFFLVVCKDIPLSIADHMENTKGAVRTNLMIISKKQSAATFLTSRET